MIYIESGTEMTKKNVTEIYIPVVATDVLKVLRHDLGDFLKKIFARLLNLA